MSGAVAALAGPRAARELRATPARVRQAAWIGAAAALATGIDLTLQLGQFMAPLVLFFAHPQAGSWRRMWRGLFIVAAAGVFTATVGGVLVQVPWLLVPAVFTITATVLYVLPPATHVVECLAILPTVLASLYLGVLHPPQLTNMAGRISVSFAIGLILATLMNRVLHSSLPLEGFAAGLAESLEATRVRLRRALRDYATGVEGVVGLEALTDLALHLQRLGRAQTAGLAPRQQRAALVLLTATERAGSAADMVSALAAQRADTSYAQLIAAELQRLGAELDAALLRFANAARRLPGDDTTPPPVQDPGADAVRGALDALEARQLALRQAGAFTAVSVAEGARTNALVDALRQLVAAVRHAPEELLALAAPNDAVASAAPPLPSVRRDELHFALKVGLATTIAVLIPIAAHVDTMINLVVAPYLVAQASYGGTIEKIWLRLAGVVIGGAICLLTMLTVMVNTDQSTIWLLWVGAVSAGCTYLIAGSPRVGYAAGQVASTFYVVLIGLQPVVNVQLVLWRVFGNLLGVGILVAVFRVVAPDYAGRQLVGRLAALLHDVAVVLPPPGAPMPPAARVDALETDIAAQVADALRLVAEARFEHGASGVTAAAAADAVGITQRIAYRAVALARARAAGAVARLEPADAAPLAAEAAAQAAHLQHTLAILAARDTRARPGSAAYARARAALSGAIAAPRPRLQGDGTSFAAHLEKVRAHALDAWPAALTGALFAEAEHLRRLAVLLAALDRTVSTLCLPAK